MSVKESFDKIDSAIAKNPEKATSVDSVFQFEFTGDEAGSYAIDLRQSTTENFVTEGTHADANVTIKMADSDWLGILSGKVNPMPAFMMGKIKVEGDMGLAMKLQSILSLAQ
ncbi:MAG: putative sterol carrier protein [Bradymonadia bacterium]|jgi:putative sterol carrier protein